MSAVPVQKPIIVSRPRPELRVEQGARPTTASSVLARAVLVGALALSVFLSSSLAGQVMVEKARREGIRATERARSAAKEEAVLRDEVLTLTRASSIDEWAAQNDFVAPENLVAQVDAGSNPSPEKVSAETLH